MPTAVGRSEVADLDYAARLLTNRPVHDRWWRARPGSRVPLPAIGALRPQVIAVSGGSTNSRIFLVNHGARSSSMYPMASAIRK